MERERERVDNIGGLISTEIAVMSTSIYVEENY